jgi:hypothetical protein
MERRRRVDRDKPPATFPEAAASGTVDCLSQRSAMSRLRISTAIAALCLGLAIPIALTTPAVAGPRIGPNQSFVGIVNGHQANAPVFMACFGPIRPGQTGHPFPNQYVEVRQAPTPVPSGFTGSNANHIFAYFVVPTPVPEGVNLTRYGMKVLIPTTFVLPCAGGGTVNFAPLPTSPTARSASVSVSFIGQP